MLIEIWRRERGDANYDLKFTENSTYKYIGNTLTVEKYLCQRV